MSQESQKYNHGEIEEKWQKQWVDQGIYQQYDRPEKFYALDMFPYPSGAGLHVGHPKGYIATDVFTRMKMLQGKSVLHPMGWDAFGLPAENYAIKNKVHPAKAVAENIVVFKQQLQKIGFTYDWDREVNTTDPAYYRWTQWIFLKLFEHGLAYEADEPINWCPSCKTGLANEDLEDGKCERCSSVVEQKKMRQWKLRMTAYADRLLEDLDKTKLQWEESIRIQQRNWIGRSEGAIVKFSISPPKADPPLADNFQFPIDVFTTRIDTIFSGTFLVLAPEHEFVDAVKEHIQNWNEVETYRQTLQTVSLIDRTSAGREITGIELKGITAINPATKESMPVWIADFVLAQYGTGAVFADAHDTRDFAMAKKYRIPLKVSIQPEDPALLEQVKALAVCYPGEGKLFNSQQFDGMTSAQARPKIVEWLSQQGSAKPTVNYKMRDWVFSRQRYWGEPIPLIHCEQCKKKKYQYVFIHGFTGSSQGVFFPWLAQELKRQGHTVFCPDLPNTEHPNIQEQVEYILDNTAINEDTILVGHSLGGVVMMKLLEQISGSVRRAVFVDPVVSKTFNDHARPDVEKSNDWKFDYAKIKSNIREVVVLADARHPIIRVEDIEKLRTVLNANQTITVHPEADHFTASQEPEILRAIDSIGTIALSEDELPLKLPEVEKYEPTGTGESPLAGIPEWVNTTCPQCGGAARRETNTMPQWAGSSWYYLRYIDPRNGAALVDLNKEKEWMPVDLYVGGAEHATRHLLYARFWHKFLYDIGSVSTIEPFKRLINVGLILAEDGRKMSKRWSNVINPDDIIEHYGADSLRLYEMFMGPFTQSIAWSTDGVKGVRRFLDRVWNLKERTLNPKLSTLNPNIDRLLHQTIKKVTDDIEGFRFNTAVSQMMILVNAMEKADSLPLSQFSILLLLLSPFAPHMAEELWHQLGNSESIFEAQWPQYDPSLAKESEVEFVVQVNGKVRDRFAIPVGLPEVQVIAQSLERDAVRGWLEGKQIRKKIFVQDTLLNIVVS
ncbi:leucine--tRNA ligase [Candidatus Uhrbacteria bacterium]|nr:leucine--tRNA ligase [Candidatus Uhrbacteria bacterium]